MDLDAHASRIVRCADPPNERVAKMTGGERVVDLPSR
jgi:hypothetical protein